MNQKVLLCGINARFSHTNLAVRCLQNSLNKNKMESKLLEFSINDRPEMVVDELFLEDAKFYCFSCYIWNISMIVNVISDLRKLRPDCTIIIGGPEVSFENEVYLQNTDIDFIICGEGEDVLPKLLSNPTAFPKRIEAKSIVDINVYSCLYNEVPKNKIIYYETTRGCPFSCSYCLSSTIQSVRYKELCIVFSDIEILVKQGVKLIKFVDRTFNVNAERALIIWKTLTQNYPDVCFHFEIGADLLTAEQLDFLKTVPKGNFQFEIGVQSTNEKTLQAVNRPWDKQRLFDAVRALLKNDNIHIHLDLIAALPYEDFSSFCRSFDEVIGLWPHMLQVGFLKMLRGCRIRSEAEKYGYVYSELPPYTALYHQNISYNEIFEIKKIEKMVDKYYNSNCFSNILKFIFKKFEKQSDFFLKLGTYFNENGFDSRPIARRELFKILLDFYSETVRENDEQFIEILRLDYVLSERTNPPWSKFRNNKLAKVALMENEAFLEGYFNNIHKKNVLKRLIVEYFEIDGGKWILFDKDRIDDVTKYVEMRV